MTETQSLERFSFSDADLQLLASSDDDIHLSIAKWSFEIEKMRDRVCVGEPWRILIQSHLYLDHIVTSILLEALVRPSAIDVSKMPFAQKLDFVHAMGLVPTPMITALKMVNSLRNSFAHKLEFDLQGEELVKIRGVCPPVVRYILDESLERKAPFELYEYLRGFIVMTDLHRQQNAKTRLLARKAKLNARRVLNERRL